MSKYIKNPAHMPDFMKHLYAKSKDDEGYQQTLADHTWLVLRRLSDQVRLRGNLADQMGDERLWHRLYWGCFLHDFGKAAQGFQERLQKDPPENTWAKRRHRHEVLSLAFVDWLFPPRHPDRLPVICVIVSHHKDARQVDFNGILDKYGAGQRKEDQLARIEELIDEIDPVDAQHLWDWLRKFGMVWQEAMGFPILEEVQPRNFASFGSQAICRALDEFSALVNLADDDDLAPSDRMAAMLRRGLIFTADHSASAGTKKFPPMPLTRAIAHTPLQKFQPNAHQIAAENAPEGSTILIAPTGSGKTEAALLWAARQIEQRPSARLFYTLPYQASMNAMYERLGERFFGMRHEDLPRNEILTIQHSRALLKFYQDMMNDERTPREVAEQAKFLKNLAKLNFYPIQIFSPYQMLKAAYSLKGYEAQLVDYANGLFIFDEIHAYDPKRMALIITLMGWLAENLHARFLVMTATLPPMVKQALQHALSIPDSDIITASPADFEASQRHTVHLRAGELLNQIVPLVEEEIACENATLVCCNRIADAQKVYRRLQSEIGLAPETEIILLHGRFNGCDRRRKETEILQAVGVRSESRRRPFVVVATQVVEVSLDVDFDTIYTDPAPLEALLQRFGRVNRGRQEKMLCPVHVFEQPSLLDADKPRSYMPYNEQLVRESLKVLRDGETIDESKVTEMLNQIYKGQIGANWQAEYDYQANLFEELLGKMRPFHSADHETVMAFYKLFDGVQVVPEDCLNDYYDALKDHLFLDASQYLVNISWGQYQQAKNKGLIRPPTSDKEFFDHILVPYDPEWGLDIYGALHQRDEEE